MGVSVRLPPFQDTAVLQMDCGPLHFTVECIVNEHHA